MPDGHLLGALFVADSRVRTLTPEQSQTLIRLARQVVALLRLGRANCVLRHRENELRLIIQTSGEAICGLDEHGRFTFVNPACLRTFGYPDPQALLGASFHDLIHHTRADGTLCPEGECAMARAVREGREARVEDDVLWRADGSPIAVIYTTAPLRRGTRVVGAVLNVVDISEQRRLRDELASAVELRERFAAVLGHDLRNPLSTVLMGARAIANASDAAASTRATAKRVWHAGERMNRLVHDLLDFVRVRAGQALPFEPRATHLGDVARAIVAEFEVANPDRRFELETTDDATGRWDPDRLAQVCSNLVANAIQHGASDEPVRVRVSREEGHAILTVQNGGRPIPQHLLPHVFDPFRGGSPGTDLRAAGLGLGLFIVRQTALAHRGDVTVVSDARHTTFAVRLPLAG